MNDELLAYVKEGLSKGYTEEQLRKILIDYKISAAEADEIMLAAKDVLVQGPPATGQPVMESPKEQPVQSAPMEQPVMETPKEQPQASQQPMSVDENSKVRLYSSLLIVGGIIAMIAVYMLRIFVLSPPTNEATGIMAIVRGFWPIIFPIIANVVNFFMYRKRFIWGLIVTVLVLLILVAVVILLLFLS